MAIESIGNINDLLGSISTSQSNEASTPFSAFLNAAVDNIEAVNELQKDADQMAVDFAVGKVDNVADVMIAQEKASVALQYTIQLRNNLLEAYNEIMRIQV